MRRAGDEGFGGDGRWGGGALPPLFAIDITQVGGSGTCFSLPLSRLLALLRLPLDHLGKLVVFVHGEEQY